MSYEEEDTCMSYEVKRRGRPKESVSGLGFRGLVCLV